MIEKCRATTRKKDALFVQQVTQIKKGRPELLGITCRSNIFCVPLKILCMLSLALFLGSAKIVEAQIL